MDESPYWLFRVEWSAQKHTHKQQNDSQGCIYISLYMHILTYIHAQTTIINKGKRGYHSSEKELMDYGLTAAWDQSRHCECG